MTDEATKMEEAGSAAAGQTMPDEAPVLHEVTYDVDVRYAEQFVPPFVLCRCRSEVALSLTGEETTCGKCGAVFLGSMLRVPPVGELVSRAKGGDDQAKRMLSVAHPDEYQRQAEAGEWEPLAPVDAPTPPPNDPDQPFNRQEDPAPPIS